MSSISESTVDVAAARRLPRSRSLADRVAVPFPAAIAAMLALTVVAFAPSYDDLTPLAGSDSPDSLLLVLPLAGFALLARSLASATRHGDEASVNAIFAAPLLLGIAALEVWLPAKLSFLYWVYRLDLLALPLFVGACVVLLFGLPALWTARRGFLLLVASWPPILDGLVRLVAEPLARVQALLAGTLLQVLAPHVRRVGETFVLGAGPHAPALTVSSACAGLVGILSMALVAGVVAGVARGSGRRRLAWLAAAVALAFVGNVLRIAAVVAVAERSGLHGAFRVFHATAGVVLFGVFLLAMLLLLPRFGLALERPRPARVAPLPFRLRGLLANGALLAAVALFSAWASSGSGLGGPGLFREVPSVSDAALLRAPAGWRVASSAPLRNVGLLFGGGSLARTYHLAGPGPRQAGVGAQVVVSGSWRRLHRYGVVACFTFHDYGIYSTRVVALPHGGAATLVALHIDGRDVATASWLQPILLDGRRAWRRVVLYRYLTGHAASTGFSPGPSRSAGLWLLNELSPYGGTRAPARFAASERTLAGLAGRLTTVRGTHEP